MSMSVCMSVSIVIPMAMFMFTSMFMPRFMFLFMLSEHENDFKHAHGHWQGHRRWTQTRGTDMDMEFNDAISGSFRYRSWRISDRVPSLYGASTNVNLTYSWTITVHSRNKYLLAYYFHSKNATERLRHYKRKFVGYCVQKTKRCRSEYTVAIFTSQQLAEKRFLSKGTM
jgi:hypothetical protein